MFFGLVPNNYSRKINRFNKGDEMKSNTWMTIPEIEMHDARDVAAGLVDKLSLAMQEVAERKNRTRAEGRHLADLRELFNRLFDDGVPHVRGGKA